MKRYDCEWTPLGAVMEEHKEGAFVPFSEISGLAEQLADATRQCGVMAELLREAIGEVPQTQSFPSRCDAALAGKMPEQHPDDTAVDRFAAAMKVKLAAARAKGRGGWDDPAACSVEYLADLLVDHVGKGNYGTFEDVANFAMMLHQRGANPAVLAHAAHLTTCSRCKGHGMIGGVTGQTPESMDFWEAECPDCGGRGKVKVEVRTITEAQELELIAVLQSIVNGFSDDPAHDAAALLKRITGEVPWTGDSFQLPPHQGGEQLNKNPAATAGQSAPTVNKQPSLTGQVLAGMGAATLLAGLDKESASDVVQLMLEAAEAKGGGSCATEPPSSSQA